MFPHGTGLTGERLPELVMGWPNPLAPMRIAMRSVDFDLFFESLWPRLQLLDAPIILVTAMQDNSVPWELFHCHLRSNATAMRSFLRDPRLIHWYTQNLDLLRSANRRIRFVSGEPGESKCTERIARFPEADSDIDPVAEADLVAKVSPLPIGVMGVSSHSCTSLPIFRAAARNALPLHRRNVSILVTFHHSQHRDRRRTAMLRLDSSHRTVYRRMDEPSLYELMGRHAFVAAPASRGQDTFRFWQTIALGAVPIVSAGPLDAFYSSLPCVIVADWGNITEAMLLEWRDHIVSRFGPKPADHPEVVKLFSSSYIARRIAAGLPIVQRPLDGWPLTRSATAIVNHTCRMHEGGVLWTERERQTLGC